MSKLLKIELYEKLQYTTIYVYVDYVKCGGKLLLYVVERYKRFKLTKVHSLTMPSIYLYTSQRLLDFYSHLHSPWLFVFFSYKLK